MSEKTVLNAQGVLSATEYLPPSMLTITLGEDFEIRHPNGTPPTDLIYVSNLDAARGEAAFGAGVTTAGTSYKGQWYIPAGTYKINLAARMSADSGDYQIYIDGIAIGAVLGFRGFVLNFREVVRTCSVTWTTPVSGYRNIEVRDVYAPAGQRYPWVNMLSFIRIA